MFINGNWLKIKIKLWYIYITYFYVVIKYYVVRKLNVFLM